MLLAVLLDPPKVGEVGMLRASLSGLQGLVPKIPGSLVALR